jgi:hypothetical protein
MGTRATIYGDDGGTLVIGDNGVTWYLSVGSGAHAIGVTLSPAKIDVLIAALNLLKVTPFAAVTSKDELLARALEQVVYNHEAQGNDKRGIIFGLQREERDRIVRALRADRVKPPEPIEISREAEHYFSGADTAEQRHAFRIGALWALSLSGPAR